MTSSFQENGPHRTSKSVPRCSSGSVVPFGPFRLVICANKFVVLCSWPSPFVSDSCRRYQSRLTGILRICRVHRNPNLRWFGPGTRDGTRCLGQSTALLSQGPIKEDMKKIVSVRVGIDLARDIFALFSCYLY